MLLTTFDLLGIIIALLGCIVALAYQFYFIRQLTEENELLWDKYTDLIIKNGKNK